MKMERYFQTWQGIAFAIGRSERWCRYMARREQDPLPVFKVGGIVCLDRDELDGWVDRERRRSAASPERIPRLQLIA